MRTNRTRWSFTKLGFWRGAQATAIAGIVIVLLKGSGVERNVGDIFFAIVAVALWPSLLLMRLADSFGIAAAIFFNHPEHRVVGATCIHSLATIQDEGF
jgi:hypothetical protein